jgi:RND family efflux transporter MFP subunit
MIRSLLLMVAVAAVACGCGKHGSAKKYSRGQTIERLPKVEVVLPQRLELIRSIDVAATVEAYQKVELAARVPGVVLAVPPQMDIGYRVKTGEKLLELDVPDLRADRTLKAEQLAQTRSQHELAQKALKVAETEVEEVRADKKRFTAEVDFAKKRLVRIRDLVRQRAQDPAVEQEAEKQLEAAQAAEDANEARAVKQRARADSAASELRLASQRIRVADADLAKLDRMIEFATVRAPFDGIITKRWVDTGATIRDPGTSLFTVMQIDKVRVLIDVPQRDVPLLDVERDGKHGDPAMIRLPVNSSDPDGLWRGVITRVGNSLDPITRTMRAEIQLNNPEGKLRPGMYGTASVTVEDLPDVLTVPASALVRRGEGLVEVFVVTDTRLYEGQRRGILKRVPVTLGIDDGKRVHIVRGLNGDELVVVRGASVMRADDEVMVLDAP